jgi:hypothetical protein
MSGLRQVFVSPSAKQVQFTLNMGQRVANGGALMRKARANRKQNPEVPRGAAAAARAARSPDPF